MRRRRNLAVTPVAIERSTFSDQERVTVTAGVANHGGKAVDGADVTLEVNGRPIQTQRVKVEPNASTSTTFAPVTLTGAEVRATVRLGNDAMARDNVVSLHGRGRPSGPHGAGGAERRRATRDSTSPAPWRSARRRSSR